MPSELLELIELTAQKTHLANAIIEKDFFVTQALHALTEIDDEYFELIFQGGTCLSKAHQLTQRMSEDCDYRMVIKPAARFLSKQKQRHYLKIFRKKLLDLLEKTGFKLRKDEMKVRNEGNFMRLLLDYESVYPQAASLRPHILLEFISINTKQSPITLPITTLIKNVLGHHIPHQTKNIRCVSIEETAAEKWVALTRRVANIQENEQHPSHVNLVRHLYDLWVIQKNTPVGENFYEMVSQLIAEDQQRHKNRNEEYAKNPIATIKVAIEKLSDQEIWQDHYNHFLNAMVFGKDKPKYSAVMDSFQKLSDPVFKKL